MTEKQTQESLGLVHEYRQLIESQQTLLLSTCSIDKEPDISYAPFVRNKQGHFYIFISALAKHTKHLLDNPLASILFIEPEERCRNLFARTRVVFQCSVIRIESGTPTYENQLRVLQDKFGEIVALLRTLPDFHLFELRPESGHYVAGFGKAYTINLNDNSPALIGG